MNTQIIIILTEQTQTFMYLPQDKEKHCKYVFLNFIIESDFFINFFTLEFIYLSIKCVSL